MQGLGGPEVVAHLVAQDRCVDLVLARELAHVQRAELGQHFFAEVDAFLPARGAEVVDPIVMAVVAGLGGGDGLQLQPAIEPALGQVGEAGIGLGVRAGRGRRFGVAVGKGLNRLRLAGGEGDAQYGEGKWRRTQGTHIGLGAGRPGRDVAEHIAKTLSAAGAELISIIEQG